MANAAEARAWMAAFHNPRYLHARGLHLASVVAGREAASEQIDLWERWAVINHRDSRGETMLHAALRGIEPGEADERQRLVAWLVDCGATLLPQPAGAPTDELLASLYKRFSSPRLGKGKSKSRAAFAEEAAAPPADEADEEVSDVPSPFALAVRLADGEGLDGLLAEAVVTMARQGAPLVGPASIDDHLSTLLHGWLDGADTAPLTHAALGAWRDANGVEPAHHMQPPPPPTTSAQNRALVLLSLSRLDCAAEPASARLAISVVHEPSSDAAGPRGGAGLASRAAAFQATEAAGAGGGGGGGGLMRRNRLATLVGEQQCASPLSSSAVGCLWWFRTWSAAYLQGEEGAMLLIKLVRATGGGEDEVLSWVALPLDEVGDHHLQMHAPPLPKSAAEARAPRSEPTSAWLHCCLDLGVTGTYAAFASRHPDLSRGPATVHRVEPLERKAGASRGAVAAVAAQDAFQVGCAARRRLGGVGGRGVGGRDGGPAPRDGGPAPRPGRQGGDLAGARARGARRGGAGTPRRAEGDAPDLARPRAAAPLARGGAGPRPGAHVRASCGDGGGARPGATHAGGRARAGSSRRSAARRARFGGARLPARLWPLRRRVAPHIGGAHAHQTWHRRRGAGHLRAPPHPARFPLPRAAEPRQAAHRAAQGGRAGGEDDAVPPPHARHRFAAAARRPRQGDAEVLLRSHLPPCRRLAALVCFVGGARHIAGAVHAALAPVVHHGPLRPREGGAHGQLVKGLCILAARVCLPSRRGRLCV
ncbi:hypothetical protein EMIHUDRAFT_449578 [Emiliania huxleyi CCMP1516]|uniref:Uncharacterized protein n=2 Tax=Emiliania huxleyi TaxID=2903 RepID=A0A0D3K908_EMIH1|nr:hypothetical protein EMIHUDRAFT_449578 [Emiliania huxleyi CCMP1516]EOD32243.1 hypothetical protein EMIHUDRAFT_449578 [Emiliania huxleyi CCMP1516]|eukprot:XP_005784672.1 hypothetical protein EMIHUDRAFT_449578 [Emiliania huxleyi CCMP1516]